MSYWTATDDYEREHGGPPTCPKCGKTMFAEDDHGRYTCFCGQGLDTITGQTPPVAKIGQVDTKGMSDKDKAKIPPIHRLRSTPTTSEAKLLAMLAKGPSAMDDSAYWEAMKAVEEEREQ